MASSLQDQQSAVSTFSYEGVRECEGDQTSNGEVVWKWGRLDDKASVIAGLMPCYRQSFYQSSGASDDLPTLTRFKAMR